jgi:hypothetical protein
MPGQVVHPSFLAMGTAKRVVPPLTGALTFVATNRPAVATAGYFIAPWRAELPGLAEALRISGRNSSADCPIIRLVMGCWNPLTVC